MTQRVIDYCIDLACEPKRKLGLERLLQCLQQLTEVPGSRPPDTAAAQEAGFKLRPLAFHCRRCPASLTHEAFGCFGSINLPLTPAAEWWFIDLLPRSLKAPKRASEEERRRVEAFRGFLEWWRARGVPEQAVRAHRLVSGTFHLRRPPSRGYGPPWRRTHVDTDLLYHLLLSPDRLDPRPAEMLCRALGLWVDGEPDASGVRPAVFARPPERDDPPEIRELKQYFVALMVACSLERAVVLRHSTVTF